MSKLRLGLAQINPTVGAIAANRKRIESRLREARALGVELALFPELVLTGYPPEDLLRNPDFLADARRALEELAVATRGLLAVVGVPLASGADVYNSAALLLDGKWAHTFHKAALPNYGVFDEKRYFRPGDRCPIYTWGPHRFGVSICEDIWVRDGVPGSQAAGGARLLLNLSASPYHAGRGSEREALLRSRARQYGTAIAYVNLVGGQDELVFDGDSLVLSAAGEVLARCPQFEEALLVLDLETGPAAAGRGEDGLDLPAAEATAGAGDAARGDGEATAGSRSRERAGGAGLGPAETADGPEPGPVEMAEKRCAPEEIRLLPDPIPMEHPPLPGPAERIPRRLSRDEEVYRALCLGTRDYVEKNGFRSVVLGLSGGIDSALTAVIAVDALAPERVLGVGMPSRFNRAATQEAARRLAGNLGIAFQEIPIDAVYEAFLSALRPSFGRAEPGVTEENLQARIRGTLLMALSNQTGRLLLTTGNKSELAVGYCTLYGDMAGGFAVLKDVPKTWVYRLAGLRNRDGHPIPEETLTFAPSAELREDQADSDTLPSYELLDAILEAKVERDEPRRALIERGLDPAWVETIYRWIDANEYKRRQAPPGIKITPRAFGRDRRYPITNRYRTSAE